MIFSCKKLPTINGDINWDIVSEDYHNYILGPYAPEMILEENNKSRNLILNYLNSVPAEQLQQMDVLDFGCGPGNLIQHIAGKVNRLVGLDMSQGSIKAAQRVASRYKNLEFKGLCLNLLELDATEKYDLVISSNSILPKSREEVVAIFNKLRQCLKPSASLVAILPSFDTTLYLKSLWENFYRSSGFDEQQIEKICQSFKQAKLMDEDEKSYADDGYNAQCYHTKETIEAEIKKAGLRLLCRPEKVYYPWQLTRRFDYGYFPFAEEEIWDWFIIAQAEEPNV